MKCKTPKRPSLEGAEASVQEAAAAAARARIGTRPGAALQRAALNAAGKLQGQAALITGGDSGIGRAVATLYAREGADVAIVYLPEEQSDAEDTRAIVEAEGRVCELIPGDLVDAAFCDEVVERTVGAFGRLDILVSNAAQQSGKKLEDLEDADLERTFQTNIFAYMRLARAALRHMKPGATIIATSSVTGIRGSKEMPDYSATKGAINAFTKTLAMELVERQIRVNAVAPGPVWTPLNPADTGATAKEAGGVRGRQPDETTRAARRTRAGVRVSGLECGFVIHHRNRAADHGGRNDRRVNQAPPRERNSTAAPVSSRDA